MTVCSEVHEEDWATAWKQYYNPVKISEKFTIVPTWEDYEPFSTDELIIELDPGMAFGTGHIRRLLCVSGIGTVRETGRSCCRCRHRFRRPCHWCAMLGAKRVTALDLDEVAVSAARQNVALNKAENVISVSKNNLIDGLDDKADVVVANILAEVIISFVKDVESIIVRVVRLLHPVLSDRKKRRETGDGRCRINH